MKAKSRKNKGSRFEKYLLERIRAEIDARAYHPKGSGAGDEKGDIVIPSHNIVIEAKNQKKIDLLKWWEQAQNEVFNENPVLAIRNPKKAEFKETFIVIELEHFLELLNSAQEEKEIQFALSYSQRSALNSLKNAINRVLKEIPYE